VSTSEEPINTLQFWPEEDGMNKLLSSEEVARYRRNGYHFPVRVLSAEQARGYRDRLETQERALGGPLSGDMRHKVHLLFTWANELARHPGILDAVEDIIGPDILCWSTTFFTKEAHSPSFVSWHQDATYWGLSTNDVVTAWIAFADAPVESGAMKFWPGSHLKNQLAHRDTFAEDNLLTRGQEIAVEVPDGEGVDVALQAGEMSLHHVLLAHGSGPNATADRRIGYAIRYIPPHVRQLKVRDSATLVRGRDTHGHFDLEPTPRSDLDPAALAAHRDAVERSAKALYAGTDRTAFRA
jgi:chlorinating enzyme